jgi:D-threonate/D-erythronate kinase
MIAASHASSPPALAILILADDLSGAADCGVACTEMGLETVVALRPGLAAQRAEALAIDGNTRAMTANAAAEVTARLALAYAQSEHCLVFKKLDSTLRGHIGPELDAILRVGRALKRDTVIILAPAFPALGRTTVEGRQRLYGAPLEESEVWRRERGSKIASLPAMLHAHGLRAGLLSLNRVRRDVEDLAAAMKMLAGSTDVIVCDAQTDTDLAAVALASMQLRSNVIWAGAAELARRVVEAAGLAKPRLARTAPAVDGSALFVVGSRSNVSKRQAAALAEIDGVVSVVADPTATRHELDSSGAALRLETALAERHDAIIWQSEGLREVETVEERPCDGLAELLAAESSRIGALFATGGETARCLLDALDVEGLELLGEIEPGVPLSFAIGPRRFPVITKAGGFGTDATMVKCRLLLRCGATLPAVPVRAPGRINA